MKLHLQIRFEQAEIKEPLEYVIRDKILKYLESERIYFSEELDRFSSSFEDESIGRFLSIFFEEYSFHKFVEFYGKKPYLKKGLKKINRRDFKITHWRVRKGSIIFELTLIVAGIFVGYGGFRESIDYMIKDLSAVFNQKENLAFIDEVRLDESNTNQKMQKMQKEVKTNRSLVMIFMFMIIVFAALFLKDKSETLSKSEIELMIIKNIRSEMQLQQHKVSRDPVLNADTVDTEIEPK